MTAGAACLLTQSTSRTLNRRPADAVIRATEMSNRDPSIVGLQLTREGLLVNSAQLSQAWGESRDALSKACVRKELFRLRIGQSWFYPAVFSRLLQVEVYPVNRALKGDDAAGKFIFWHRTHGGLGGRDVCHALRNGLFDRVLELAFGWSEERGLGRDDSHC